MRAIFTHLFNAHHHDFKYGTREARDLAADRVREIDQNSHRLRATPYIGTKHEIVGATLRHVTFNRTIYWFEVDERTETVRVLGIFHGGQDHLARMLARLTAEGGAG